MPRAQVWFAPESAHGAPDDAEATARSLQELVVTIHGRAHEIDKASGDYDGFRECLGEVYGKEGMPQLSQTASHPDFLKVSNWQFRNITTMAIESPFIAKWLDENGAVPEDVEDEPEPVEAVVSPPESGERRQPGGLR